MLSMQLARAWCLCLSLSMAAATASYGGPPLADLPDGGREPHRDLPLPGKEIERVPVAAMPPSGEEELPHIIRFVYADAIPLASAYEVGRAADTPAEPLVVAAEAPAPAAGGSQAPAPVPAPAPAPAAASSGGIRQRIQTLANRVTSWLPDLSAYLPHLPSYLPGLDLELEAHPHPLKVPHIPSPTELVRDFNSLVDTAMEKLHRKHQEIAELVKCTTPIPKECQHLFQDLARPPGLSSGAGAGSPAAAAPDGKPLISFYAGYTKPEGQSHGLGFYVDDHGRPHLGHPGPPPVGTKGGKDSAPAPAAKPEGQSAAAVSPAAAAGPAAGADGIAADKPDAPAPAPAGGAAPESGGGANSPDKKSPADSSPTSSPAASS